MEPKKPYHEVVAEKLIEQLKAGTAPWQKPWEPGEPSASLPINAATGKRYKGINVVHLLAQGRSDTRWMTYKQAAAAGAQVRRGEKGTTIQYWKNSEERNKLDDRGRPVIDAKGQPVKETVKLEHPRVFFATVFNGEQIDGLPPRQPTTEQTWNSVERAEHILKASGATIIHAHGDQAFYRPQTDSITLPERGQFTSSDRYYATALHELGHWTGHPSRLDRDLTHPHGSEEYAKEELRAEIASMIIGNELGIGHDPGQHAAYVDSWIKALENDPMEVFRAAAAAEKINDYVLAFEQVKIQQQGNSQQEFATTLRENTLQMEQATEVWMLQQLEQGTVNRVFEGASLEQIDHALDVLDRMQPMNTQNEFWARHELPFNPEPLQKKINAAMDDLIENRRPDAVVAATFLDLKTERMHGQAFDTAADNALGFTLPHDWTGEIRVVGMVEQNDGQMRVAADTETPDAYHLYARKGEAQPGSDAFAYLTATRDLDEAHELADRLAFIDANAQPQEWQKIERIDRAWENRIRRDPNSTEEDIYTRTSAALDDRVSRHLAMTYDTVQAYTDAKNIREQKQEQQAEKEAQTEIPQDLAVQQEFAAVLREKGLVIDGLPEMDGEWHRVATLDDKPGKQSASYMASLEGGVPNGAIHNFRTGERVNWASTGGQTRELTPEEREQIAQQRVSRAEQKTAEWEERSKGIQKEWRGLPWAQDSHEYLQRKGVENHGLKLDRHGNLVMPLQDIDDKLWSVQRISADGDKLFTKGGRTQACFCVVGDEDPKKPIVIAEGYATSCSVYENTGLPVVCALNAGNLEPVAKAFREKYPDRPIFIAGDNDHTKEADGKPNVGKEKSIHAAEAVGGHVLLPNFKPDDRGTDWNDLAASQGKQAVLEQISRSMQENKIDVKLAPFRELRDYINVPYKDKDEASQLGASWDRTEKKWYVPASVDAAPFAKWAKDASQERAADTIQSVRDRQAERAATTQAPRKEAPRNGMDYDPAQSIALAAERVNYHLKDIKEKMPGLTEQQQEIYANWRSQRQAYLGNRPEAEQKAELEKLDKIVAGNPALLERLEKAGAAPQESAKQEHKDYEQSL